MPTKNLKELRALARSHGLRGYSKLSHRELEKLLSSGAGQKPAVAWNRVHDKNVGRLAKLDKGHTHRQTGADSIGIGRKMCDDADDPGAIEKPSKPSEFLPQVLHR